MIHEQASKLTAMMVSRNIITDELREVYTYGLELIVSALINILLIAIISIFLQRYYDWLLFLCAFIPLRMFAGGYHANSHFKCIIVGSIGFLLFLAISRLQINWTIIILVTAVLSLLAILLFSPTEAHNKKLKENQRKKNRFVSIFIGLLNLLIAATVIFIHGLSDILNIYFLGVFAAVFSMLAINIKNLKKVK
jgi:accessory gene regulator B